MSTNQAICNRVKDVLSKEPEVLAIFNNGAAVVGMAALGSDVDFVVILKNDRDEGKIIKVISKNFKVIKNEDDPNVNVEEQWDILGKRCDFCFRSKNEMDKKVNTFYDSKSNFLELQHFLKHKIVDAVAIYDPKNLLNSYQKKIKKYPNKILNQVIKDSIQSLKENLYYWNHHGFRNEFQFNFEMWDVIREICHALYAKNKRLFMLPYKRLHKDLKELKPNIEKEMYALVRGINTPQNIAKKAKILKKIIEKLEK